MYTFPPGQAGLAAALMALLLAGCAGANFSNLRETSDTSPAAPLLVVVERPTASPAANSTTTSLAADPATTTLPVMSEVLVDDLRKSGVACAPATPGATSSGSPSLLLTVGLRKVATGNAFDRDVVGLGSGQSSIAAHVSLDDPHQPSSQQDLEFDVRSSSGSMPGLLLSAGPIGLAVKGTRMLVFETTSDGHKEADRAAVAITKKVVAYFRERGWLPPESNAAPS